MADKEKSTTRLEFLLEDALREGKKADLIRNGGLVVMGRIWEALQEYRLLEQTTGKTWEPKRSCTIHSDREAVLGYSYQREEFCFPAEILADDPDGMPLELCCNDCAFSRHGARRLVPEGTCSLCGSKMIIRYSTLWSREVIQCIDNREHEIIPLLPGEKAVS